MAYYGTGMNKFEQEFMNDVQRLLVYLVESGTLQHDDELEELADNVAEYFNNNDSPIQTGCHSWS